MVLATGSGDAKTTPPILLMLNKGEAGGRLRSLLPMPARRMGWWAGHAAPTSPFPLPIEIDRLPTIRRKVNHRYFDKFI